MATGKLQIRRFHLSDSGLTTPWQKRLRISTNGLCART